MNRQDKKAWLRIVEAFLAVLIILGSVLVILSRQAPESDIDDSVYEKQRQILEIISKNNSLRGEIINTTVLENNVMVNNAIGGLIPSSWGFATRICDLDKICSNPEAYENKNVYVTEVVITSTLNDYSPKKLRFFVWGK